VAGFAGRADLQGTVGSLWITGLVSPEAQRQFAALGWTVYQHVPPRGRASAAIPSMGYVSGATPGLCTISTIVP
jgi:hypothetical protein